MKCSNCGAETQGQHCEYCGCEMPQEKPSVTIVNNYYSAAPTEGHLAAPCPECYSAPQDSQKTPSKRKTWLWVLGWICIFPLPLTILLLRSKRLAPAVKYILIALAWILFIIIGISADYGIL